MFSILEVSDYKSAVLIYLLIFICVIYFDLLEIRIKSGQPETHLKNKCIFHYICVLTSPTTYFNAKDFTYTEFYHCISFMFQRTLQREPANCC